MKKSVQRAALTGGIVWGVSIFILTLISVPTGYATAFLNVIASIYPGFSVSLIGAVVGLIYGFIDAFVGIYIINWVYNNIAK